MLEPPDYLQIGKRRAECAACGASLAETVRHPSVLVERERTAAADPSERSDEPDLRAASASAGAPSSEKPEDASRFARFDYCDACWNEMKQAAYFSFWVGRRGENDAPRRKLNRVGRNLALVALFDSLSERNGEENDFDPHLYFLAHLLMKYRVFKWLPSETDPETGQPRLRFARTDSDEPALVSEVEMDDETIARIKQEIEAYLEQSTGQPIRL